LRSCLQHSTTHCNTLQNPAAHCNTLQHTATHTIPERTFEKWYLLRATKPERTCHDAFLRRTLHSNVCIRLFLKPNAITLYHHTLSRTVSSHSITNCIITFYHELYHQTLSQTLTYLMSNAITLYHHTPSRTVSSHSITNPIINLCHHTPSSYFITRTLTSHSIITLHHHTVPRTLSSQSTTNPIITLSRHTHAFLRRALHDTLAHRLLRHRWRRLYCGNRVRRCARHW